jgi:hypothetical protein
LLFCNIYSAKSAGYLKNHDLKSNINIYLIDIYVFYFLWHELSKWNEIQPIHRGNSDMKTNIKTTALGFVALALAFTSMATYAEDTPASATTFESLDANKDASLDQSEVAADALLTDQFTVIDVNKDNLISSDEYKAHKEQAIRESQAAN